MGTIFVRSGAVMIAMAIASVGGVSRAQEGTVATSGGAPEEDGAELGARLTELRRGAGDLDARVGETYRRLASIDLSIRGDDRGVAQLRITHRDHVAPFFGLTELSYALDGHRVMHLRQPDARLEGALELHVTQRTRELRAR